MPRVHAVHFREIRELAAEVQRADDFASAASLIARRLSALFGLAVAVTRTDLPEEPESGAAADGSPVPSHEQAAGPPPEASPVPSESAEDPPESLASRATDLTRAHVPVGEHDGARWWIELPGNWTAPLARTLTARLGDALQPALAAVSLREGQQRSRQMVAEIFRFSRELSTLAGGPALGQAIADALARAAAARVATLALYDASAGTLRIAATHGYPALMVEHVRPRPGDGVLGRVLATRRPLLVRDIGAVAGLRPRPRYRTRSCVAVPLMAGQDILGVAALADRLDGRAFDATDLTLIRTLAAPAALALQTARVAQQLDELAHAATSDPLTGLFNRRHFEGRIEEEMERARRQRSPLALMLIDVDDFKRINDTFGHLGGDDLLRQVADVLKRSVRVFDVCTRYGGEEFAVLMPGSSVEHASIVAERIRTRVATASREEGVLPAYVRVTVSVGLAVLGTDAAPQDLIARADRALYQAKREGKNRVMLDE